MSNNTRKYISVAEAAEETGLSTRTVQRLITRGDLPARKIGRRVLIPAEALDLDNLGKPFNPWVTASHA